MANKSPLDNDVMQRIICVLQLKFKETPLSLQKFVAFLSYPNQYKVETWETLAFFACVKTKTLVRNKTQPAVMNMAIKRMPCLSPQFAIYFLSSLELWYSR